MLLHISHQIMSKRKEGGDILRKRIGETSSESNQNPVDILENAVQEYIIYDISMCMHI